jgi:hypothetical protein
MGAAVADQACADTPIPVLPFPECATRDFEDILQKKKEI